MAEPLESTAIVPARQGDARDYKLDIVEFDAAGKRSQLSMPIPADATWGDRMFRAALLKQTTWKEHTIPTILHAVYYSDNLGLDIMAGDVYMAAEGRLATTAGAKIKHALSSGRIDGYSYSVEQGPLAKFPWKTKNAEGVFEHPNLRVTVTVRVKGWAEPFVYSATLKEWFTGRNPNWRERTEHMLVQNAISKALAFVAPMGVEADEMPPAEPAPLTVKV